MAPVEPVALVGAFLGALGGFLGAYVAVRVELARIGARLDMVHADTVRAHARIDALHGTGGE